MAVAGGRHLGLRNPGSLARHMEQLLPCSTAPSARTRCPSSIHAKDAAKNSDDPIRRGCRVSDVPGGMAAVSRERPRPMNARSRVERLRSLGVAFSQSDCTKLEFRDGEFEVELSRGVQRRAAAPATPALAPPASLKTVPPGERAHRARRHRRHRAHVAHAVDGGTNLRPRTAKSRLSSPLVSVVRS